MNTWGWLPTPVLSLIYECLHQNFVHSNCQHVSRHWRGAPHPEPGRDIILSRGVCHLWQVKNLRASIISGRDLEDLSPTPILLSVHVLRSLTVTLYQPTVIKAVVACLSQMRNLEELDLVCKASYVYAGHVEFPASLESAELTQVQFTSCNLGEHKGLETLVLKHVQGVVLFPPNLRHLEWTSESDAEAQQWHAALDLEHLTILSFDEPACRIPPRSKTVIRSKKLRTLKLAVCIPGTLEDLPPTLESIYLWLPFCNLRQRTCLPLVRELTLHFVRSATAFHVLCPNVAVLEIEECALSVREVEVFCALPLQSLRITQRLTDGVDAGGLDAAMALIERKPHSDEVSGDRRL